jgi:hypothetical protein
MRRLMIAVAAAFAASAAYATPQYPLEVRFEEWHADGKHALYDMPVTVTDANGQVVYEGKSKGPEFTAELPKGRYTVAAKWDDWSFSRTVDVNGKSAEPLVFAWDKRDLTSSTG